MKKPAFIFLGIILFAVNIYSVDVSFSGQLGAGTPVLRSSFATVQKAVALQNGDFGIKSYKEAIFNVQGQGIILLEITPFLATEFGLGLRYSQQFTAHKNASVENSTNFQRFELTLPINFRAQFSYPLDSLLFDYMTTYATIGPKISFPFLYGYTEDILGSEYQGFAGSVNLDLSFSVGQEVRIMQGFFAGIRVSYDLNLVDTISKSLAQGDSDTEENFIDNYGKTYHDDFTVYLTIRKMM